LGNEFSPPTAGFYLQSIIGTVFLITTG